MPILPQRELRSYIRREVALQPLPTDRPSEAIALLDFNVVIQDRPGADRWRKVRLVVMEGDTVASLRAQALAAIRAWRAQYPGVGFHFWVGR